MSNSLWPDFSTVTPTHSLREMLYQAAGDIDAQTKGAIQFYVDILGVSGTSRQVRHNCYLRVPKTSYNHLLSSEYSGARPLACHGDDPEGDQFPPVQDEPELRAVIQKILQRERAKEIVLYLLSTVS
jgi:hypothetical protein